jgi:56kDa selenium binding protein (SBP56)
LFAWTGDPASVGNDFLAVIDADPASPGYGHLVMTVVTDQQTGLIHHTEYTQKKNEARDRRTRVMLTP